MVRITLTLAALNNLEDVLTGNVYNVYLTTPLVMEKISMDIKCGHLSLE
jgi:hypothetical protein